MLCPTAERLLPRWTEADFQAFFDARLKVHGNPYKAHNEWRQKVNRQRYIPAKVRNQILDWECIYCGGTGQVIDHYIPLARGGYGVRANLVPACELCNQDKSALFVDEWRARREGLGRPWPPPNTHDIRYDLLQGVRPHLERAVLEGRMPLELTLEFRKVLWSYQKRIFNGADVWTEAITALAALLAVAASSEQAGVDAGQGIEANV